MIEWFRTRRMLAQLRSDVEETTTRLETEMLKLRSEVAKLRNAIGDVEESMEAWGKRIDRYNRRLSAYQAADARENGTQEEEPTNSVDSDAEAQLIGSAAHFNTMGWSQHRVQAQKQILLRRAGMSPEQTKR